MQLLAGVFDACQDFNPTARSTRTCSVKIVQDRKIAKGRDVVLDPVCNAGNWVSSPAIKDEHLCEQELILRLLTAASSCVPS